MKKFFQLDRCFRRRSYNRQGVAWLGFTLIELLIVIAIILILISIALPNFLEAQIRAKVAKCKGEIRSITTALETYYLDFKTYPCESEHNPYERNRFERGLLWLTSPVKYMSRIPEDPFSANRGNDKGPFVYETGGLPNGLVNKCMQCLATWAIFTDGPDQLENQIVSATPYMSVPEDDGSVDSYSPTNGSRSLGDIFQYGGDPFWIGVAAASADRKNYTPAKDRGLVVDRELYLHRLPPKLR